MSDQDENIQCSAVLRWVQEQNVPTDTAAELTLPPQLLGASEDGSVQAARTRDGRLCILLKKRIGWKSNFEGLLCCDSPLQDDELIESGVGDAYISLPGLGIFEELYIRKAHGREFFDVYFDLN